MYMQQHVKYPEKCFQTRVLDLDSRIDFLFGGECDGAGDDGGCGPSGDGDCGVSDVGGWNSDPNLSQGEQAAAALSAIASQTDFGSLLSNPNTDEPTTGTFHGTYQGQPVNVTVTMSLEEGYVSIQNNITGAWAHMSVSSFFGFIGVVTSTNDPGPSPGADQPPSGGSTGAPPPPGYNPDGP